MQVRIDLLREALARHGAARIRVHGGSMWPWLRPEDELEIRREELARIAPGQIVLFERDARLFAHRVLRRLAAAGSSAPQLITKGDTLAAADAPVNEAELLGRVVAVRRGRREIHLDTLPQAVLGRLCALLTYTSRAWYPLALAARRVTRSQPGRANSR
jgi:hypothetical protein